MPQLTQPGLLAATGYIWKVLVYRDGNYRRVDRVLFVRARNPELARAIGQMRSGRKAVIAFPWNPFDEAATMQYVRFVD